MKQEGEAESHLGGRREWQEHRGRDRAGLGMERRDAVGPRSERRIITTGD